MDLGDTQARRARELGVPLVIDSDAHSPDGLADTFWGIAMARRAGLEAKDVLNTLEWNDLRKKLKRNRQ
jgi:DNA polymerase (family 10)